MQVPQTALQTHTDKSSIEMNGSIHGQKGGKGASKILKGSQCIYTAPTEVTSLALEQVLLSLLSQCFDHFLIAPFGLLHTPVWDLFKVSPVPKHCQHMAETVKNRSRFLKSYIYEEFY